MAEYEINGKKIELDTSKTYMDFYKQDGRGHLAKVNLEALLVQIQAGRLPVDDDIKEYMQYLKRWQTDAPRKRALREMKRGGVTVVTTDALFEEDGGEKIIDNLENTGVFAAYFLHELCGE